VTVTDAASGRDEVRFRLLGAVDAWAGGRRIDLGPARQRCLLALLLLHANQPVPTGRLVDLMWGEHPNAHARNTVQVYVSRLRRALASVDGVRLVTARPGYRVEVDPDRVDLHRFRRMVADARSADGDEQAAVLLRRALGLWRGQPLDDVAPEHLRASVCAVLAEERIGAWEELVDVEMRLGHHARLLAELRDLAEQHPLRERVAAQYMTALHRTGRRAEALAHYRGLRERFARELGINPSAMVDDLHQRILRDDPDLHQRPAAARPGGGAPAAGHVPAELPADLPTFTGRDAELAHLPELLAASVRCPAAPAIGVIDGMAGVGKTALAVHWAHHVRDRFPDGQLFVELHGFTRDVPPTDPADALDRILRTLGVPGDRVPRGLDERAALYRSLLADRRVLVVLDNAASERQVTPLLPGTPGCLVLVTSRRRLTGLDGARPLSLDVLPPADAVALFTQVAGSERLAGCPPELVGEIVERCGRLPLAVHLAAARLRARPTWTPADLADRLADRHTRLTELVAGPRGVAAAFDLSYREVGPEQRLVFRRLGLHPGTEVEPYATAALAGVTAARARALLEDLVDAHLLAQHGPDAYRLHDLIRQYARQCADGEETEPDRERALTRLFDHYLHTASVATGLLYPQGAGQQPATDPAGTDVPPLRDRSEAAAWLEEQLCNLTSATAVAATVRPAFSTALSEVLWRHLYERDHFAAAYTIHGYALAAARQSGDLLAQARALLNLGVAHARLGHYGEALEHLRTALPLFGRAGDRPGQLRTLGNLGVLSERLGDYDGARETFGHTLELYREVGDLGGQARTLVNLGIVHGRLGDYAPALDSFGQALELYLRLGDRGGQARAHFNLGIAHGRVGHHDAALDHHARALALFDEIGSHDQEGGPLNDIGNIHRRAGDHELALDHHRRALAVHRENGNRGGEAEVLNDMGRTLHAAGRAVDALAHHRDSLAIADAIGDRYEQARAHDGMAHAHSALGRPDLAREHWQRALAVFTELRSPEAREVRANLTG
jgi:DNA-binding SARP family transcriptional activator/tetratricopeptide (TPR) repeat protein